ncbi:FmdB family zinc ribbon protein [Treponema sp. R6D11]
MKKINIFIIIKTIMPTYEYECKNCSHTFEVFQSMNDPPLKECPKCGKEVRRLIFGGAGVIFKGSGFYVTDKGKSTTEANSKPSSDKKTKKSESSQSTPAASSPCSECPKKGASTSCQA